MSNIFKILLLLLFSIGLYAEDYKLYNLYNNKFQAVFPASPTNLKQHGVDVYYAGFQDKKLVFTTQLTMSGFENDIGEYKQSTKSIMDNIIKSSLKVSNYNLSAFHSTFNRKKNIYEAIYNAIFYEDGIKRNISTKYIIYGKKLYKWSVIYTYDKHKNIFDDYQNEVKVLK